MLPILGVFALIAILSALEGLMLSVAWNWYVPLLGGPHISIPVSVGISCIASMLTGQWEKRDDDDVIERVVMNIVRSLILLATAWFFHLFI